MIVQYEVIAAKSSKAIVDRITALLKQGLGWQPQGGITYNVATQQYAQVIVRHEAANG